MVAKLFVAVLPALALLVVGVPRIDAAQPTTPPAKIISKFRYSVKFVCGQAPEPRPCVEFRDGSGNSSWICPPSTVPAGANGAQVVRGLYATAINVQNPGLTRNRDDGTAVFAKKVAFAFPWQEAGPVSRFERAILEPDHAFEIDCEEIAAKFLTLPADSTGPPPFPVFLKGFVLIVSPVELDITAVYTARPLDGGASTIDVEVIQPRKQEQAVAADIPVDIPSDSR
jgi:hypothetical protein